MFHYLKTICTLILIVGFFSGCSTKTVCDFSSYSPQPYDGQPFTVMTYNIRVGVGPARYQAPVDTRENLDAIAEVIRESGANIVLLQEVDRASDRTSRLDQLDYLADALDMESAWAAAIDDDNMQYGIGVLSVYPILESQKIILPRIDYSQTHPEAPAWYSEPRSLLISDIQIGDQVVQVYNTHLGITLAERKLQLATIADTMKERKMANVPLIFGGDLNSEPDDSGLIPIRRLMKDAYHIGTNRYGIPTNKPIANRLTYPAIEPNRCIDYIFHSAELTCSKTEVLDDQLSDHLAVVCGFE